MQIFAQGRQLHTVTVTEETTVDELKALMSEAEGVPAEEQVVTFGGVPLENGEMLSAFVPEMGTVTVTARLLGGEE